MLRFWIVIGLLVAWIALESAATAVEFSSVVRSSRVFQEPAADAMSEAESDDDDEDEEEEDEDDALVTDRPDFTEASSTVGRGVLQMESGYTFARDRSADVRARGHSAPELLLRYGITEQIELRFVWNYLWERATDGTNAESLAGATDLVLGTKIALTTEQGWRPESALIVAASLPTGGVSLTNDQAKLQLNYLYAWDLPHDFSLSASTGYFGLGELEDRATGQFDHFNQFHQSCSLGIPVSDSIGAYVEYFGLYFTRRASNVPENYMDGGFTYRPNDDTQFDIRAGIGLNEAATDFFTGVGFSRRFR